MQVQIVWHHGRPEDTNRDVKHLSVLDNLKPWHETRQYGADIRLGEQNLCKKAASDGDDEGDDDRLDVTKSLILQIHHSQDIERGQAHSPDEGKAEEKVQRDGGPDHLSEIAGADCELAQKPQDE